MADRYAGVIVDLEVVADTGAAHLAAWKELFDGFLAAHDPQGAPFDDDDYCRLVQGRPRIDGVTGYLAARQITVPLGSPSDAPSLETAWGLANRKSELFVASVHAQGIPARHGAAELLGRLRSVGVRTALVTPSRNAHLVLRATGTAALFDVQVDGTDAAEHALDSPPDPAMVLHAAHRLGADPGTVAVLARSPAVVAAASAGGFGLVVALGPEDQAAELARAGADLVVADPAQMADEVLVSPEDPWVLAYRGLDPATEGTREALLTLANGYMGTRGAMVHAPADPVHYPGTYVAGTYNRLLSHVGGQVREDESMVNIPNWLPMTFQCGTDGTWWAPGTGALREHRVALDLRSAMLVRQAVVQDPAGRRTRLAERRIVSMDDPHLAAIELRLVPENWSGTLEVRSLVDGGVTNDNVVDYRGLANRHWAHLARSWSEDTACVVATASRSHVRVAVAARLRAPHGPLAGPLERVDQDKAAGHLARFSVAPGQEVVVEKVAAVATSRDPGVAEPSIAATQRAKTATSFDALLAAHRIRWAELWSRFALEITDGSGGDARAVRVHLFHVLQTLSAHTADVDAGVPARGLHGEGYQGHVFWDELFVFPVLDLRLPELTRALLLYRWRRLAQARRLASATGGAGARFPWQSGSDGREETPRSLFNPRSRRWMPDASRRQCHVNLAIAYNVWRHFQVTADLGFLTRHGAELLVETARFFAHRARHDPGRDRFDLLGVMGPDEFHDGYPDRPGEGIDNNAYVNVMAAWALARARETYDLLGPHLGGPLWRRLGLDRAELDLWERVRHRLAVPFLPNGLLAQFAGYGELAEFDWAAYRDRYGDIGRLDLILEAEGDSTNRYQASKQADVLMLFYLLSAEELTELLAQMGYAFDPATIPATVDHYLARTTHGSTLSRVAHAWVLARTDRTRSWDLFRQTLRADLAETPDGATSEGIHLGAMAGSLDILQRCYTGLDPRGDVLWLNPRLPDELRSLQLVLQYRDQLITVRVDHQELTLAAAPGPALPVTVGHVEDRAMLAAGTTVGFPLRPAPPAPRPGRPRSGAPALALPAS